MVRLTKMSWKRANKLLPVNIVMIRFQWDLTRLGGTPWRASLSEHQAGCVSLIIANVAPCGS